MRRRALVRLAAGAVAAGLLPALAQTNRPLPRIAYFGLGSAQSNASWLAAFRDGMAALRWVEGRDYVIEARYANGVSQSFPGLADELVARQPNLLLTTADEAVRQLAQRTKTIPIVFAIGQDPVGNRLVSSLRRPGGNVTGLTNVSKELGAKRLQLLTEALPAVAHVIVFFEVSSVAALPQVKEIEDAGARLGVRVTSIGLKDELDIPGAFKRATTLGAHAHILTTGALMTGQRKQLADQGLRIKVPAMAGNSEYPEAGGLISYSVSYLDNFRRTAAYVDKILKGANPGELPVEQPTRFELVVNAATAKAMNIDLPQSFRLRVDKWIE